MRGRQFQLLIDSQRRDTYRLLLLRIPLRRSSVPLLHSISSLRTAVPSLRPTVRLTAIPRLTLRCAVPAAVARLALGRRGVVVISLLRRTAESTIGLVLVVLESQSGGVSVCLSMLCIEPEP